MSCFKLTACSFVLLSMTVHVSAQTTQIPEQSMLAHEDPQRIIIATTVIPGSSHNTPSRNPQETDPSNKSPMVVSPQPTQTWNTSILCRHLANLTRHNPVPENVVEVPIEAKCFPGFACVNGVCTGGMSCKCFDGWAGLFCQAPCPTDCAPSGTCVTSTSNQAICVCNETSRYTPGIGCVEKPPEFFITTTAAPVTTPENLRVQSERECFGAFTCLYGYCQFSSLQCVCDPGWKGQLCDQPCELNCSGHGRCREDDEFILRCVCDPSYEGEFCEIVLHSKATIPSTHNSSLTKEALLDMSAWYDQNAARSGKTKLNPMSPAAPRSTNTSEVRNDTMKDTTLRPFSERECLPGVVCKHGYCLKEQRSCVCDRGWGGAICNQTCALLCENSGTCVVKERESPHCKCQKNYVGKNCEIKEAVKPATKRTIDSLADDPWKQLARENGELGPLAGRQCRAGFVCAFGSCSKQENGVEGCKCDPRFTGTFCQTPCPLTCDSRAHCEFSVANKTTECHCDNGNTYPNCTGGAEQQMEPLTTTATASLATALILLTLLLFIILPLVLYRKHNINMMKIIYLFRGFEENDNKEYDAFVWYVSADQDRQFVIQTLVPKLEGRMCFTLCIHQRNLVPGISTSNNSTELIRKSRRIIIILSHSFITTESDKDEYHTALQEMLTEKNNILLILLGDINDAKKKIDDSFKNILASATSLKYPSKNASQQEYDKFWKRLELLMPKKKPNHLESGKGQSCLTSPSTSSSLDPLEDPKAPLEIRLFANENLNTQLLQRIVRVPATKLDSSEKNLSSSIAFDKIVGTTDINAWGPQRRSSQASLVDMYHPLHQSGSSSPVDLLEGILNNGFSHSQFGHSDGDSRDGLLTGRSSHSNDGSWTTTIKNGGRDDPVSVLESYLGEQALEGNNGV